MAADAHRYLGIDVGSTTVKGVVIDDEQRLLGSRLVPVTGDYQQDIEAVVSRLSDEGAFDAVIATGYGQDLVANATRTISEISCHARGIHHLFPEIQMVIDVGGQDLKAIVASDEGRPQRFLMNDKCAAGTGRFLEVMARALRVPVAGLAALSDSATGSVKISSMCTVFAESEVISLLSRNTSRADVARGLHEAIAERISSLANRLGKVENVAMAGGVAQNRAVVSAVARRFKCEIVVPEHPQLVGALGAALAARDLHNRPRPR